MKVEDFDDLGVYTVSRGDWTLPYNLNALDKYAKCKGVEIVDLSEVEKNQFLLDKTNK